MSDRISICVGCNTYDSQRIGDLLSAELDALSVHEKLINKSVGAYSENDSEILASPTLSSLRAALKGIAGIENISTLTFYFAGHGVIRNGNYYLVLRDSNLDALSLTAFALSDLFRVISDFNIPHSNIILDTCHSGAAWSQLGPLLNSENMGSFNTPGVFILAMSASDESACEDEKGGFGTQALVKCLSGELLCNTESPNLNLIDIGNVVREELKRVGQDSFAWGLNLLGSYVFCRNPNYKSDNNKDAFNIEESIPVFDPIELKSRKTIWHIYSNLPYDWSARNFYKIIDSIIIAESIEDQSVKEFLRNISEAFAVQAQRNTDSLIASEVYAVCSLLVWKHRGDSDVLKLYSGELYRLSLEVARQNINIIVDKLGHNKNHLISQGGGGGDFYYLPIRVSKLLGWAVAIDLISHDESKEGMLCKVFGVVYEHYSLSMIAMNEIQTPYTAIACHAFLSNNDAERAEQLISPYLNSIAEEKGLIAHSSINGDQAFHYLAEKYSKALSRGSDIVAQPSEFIAVCLVISAILKMEPVMDEFMSDLDHAWVNFYLPDDYTNFGDERLEHGSNSTLRIGTDIWTVSDFIKIWPEGLVNNPTSKQEYAITIMASILFPDRTPWHIFSDEIRSYKDENHC